MMLEARGLFFSYKNRASKKQVLEHACITINRGEIVGLSAPSGAGKTTLCKLLSGYEKPDSGLILLEGRTLLSYRGFCPVQMIWQHPEHAVDPLLTLGETLNEAGSPDAGVIDGLGIEREWLARYPSELSGGELQRICIARALRPPLRFLLCDEATAMLDLATQAQIWNFLLAVAERRNIGLLVVSHSAALLAQLCSRIEAI